MTTKWQEYKEKRKLEIGLNNKSAKPWDFINPNTEYVLEEQRDKRYSLCLDCDKLIKLTKQCKECGCFMAAKTALLHATCPIGKW